MSVVLVFGMNFALYLCRHDAVLMRHDSNVILHVQRRRQMGRVARRVGKR